MPAAVLAQEVVYIGDYDNTNDFRLQSDGTAIPLDSVTEIIANINGVVIVSTNLGADLIRWNQLGFEVGEVRCRFGAAIGLEPGYAPCYLIVKDPTNPNGVVFGPTHLLILQLP